MKKRNPNTPRVLSLDALSSASNPRLQVPVTLFKGTHAHPQRHFTLGELVAEIRTADVEKLTHSQSISSAYEQYLIQATEQRPQAKAAYNDLKKNLNGFLMGKFTHRANDQSNCLEYVPCLVFDLDSCTSNYQAFELQQKLQILDYVFAVFPSPSGHGLRILVWTSSTYETHRIVYKQVLAALTAYLNITTDRKEGIHLDATCENESRHFYYVAIKPQEFYLNVESKVFKSNPTKILGKSTQMDKKKPISIEKNDDFVYIDEISEDVKIDFIIKNIDMNKPRKLQCFDFGCRCCENNVPFEAAKRKAMMHFYDSEHKNPEKIIETQLKEGYEQTQTRYTDEQFAAYLLKKHQIKVINNTKQVFVKNKKMETLGIENTPLKQDSKSVFRAIERKLKEHYEFRRNIINQEIELRIKPNGHFETMEDSEFNNLIRFLSDEGINISHKRLETSLFSDFTPKYDPIQLYFEGLPVYNQQIDYIQELCTYVVAKNQTWFELMFRKMLVRSIACSLGLTVNKHCFVLFGGQHNGKTNFLRYLCPPDLTFYRKENFKTDKDGILALGQNFWIVLDELDRLKKEDSEGLKSVFSMDSTKERLPFGKVPMKFKRIANFVGTTNKKEILSDETGNIRWLVMEIMSIKHDNGRKNGYCKINVNNIWAQAYYLLKTSFNYDLSPEDFVHSEMNNEAFKQVSVEKESLVQYFALPEAHNADKVKLMTSTNILTHLQKITSLNNLKLYSLRKALVELGFEEKFISKIGKMFSVVEKK